MSRRDAREKAFMLLYQLEIQKGALEDQLTAFIDTQEIKPGDTDYFSELVRGVRGHLETLDAIFEPLLKRWTKDRLPRIDLSILRLAVYEMRFVEAVPDNVAISEAVLLAKKYSSEESRSYINAVLGRISQEAVK
ncbi:MAG: transcription antitermination factor NusB [Clostridia bacterium]|nr:transcription antitermination factor NusB [Eubacteriales bacterium]MDD3866359.1 transcription antitermination factor NusB [Eubacteriales bacterium]MDD4461064.1 transcription antitermination factor NusB [Eubacteriales bacterium]NCC48557.1 transcription antitermination factor NusB [Clostridia bacterium]